MALEFPFRFPSAFVEPVVAARVRAEREFRDEAAAGPARRAKTAALSYVITIVAAFGQQACEAGRAGAIQLQSIESYVDDFERRAFVHAYYELPLKRWWHSWESFHDEVMHRLHDSDEWQAFLADLQRAAESVVAGARQSALRPSKSEAQRLNDARGKRRRAVVEPLLRAKGLTPSGWATAAGVNPSVAYDYLSGRSRPRRGSRNELASVLGIPESKLPD